MQDKRELLKQPLHGIYIPVLLIIFGTLVFGVEYLPYSITFIVVICSINFYSVWSKSASLHYLKWRNFELIDKIKISRNTAIYRFKLGREDEVLDVPTGHHLACCFTVNGKDEIRFYSPISSKFDAGFFDIIVKTYPTGVVSREFDLLALGQSVMFRGPVGSLDYKPNMAKKLGLVCGGTGITPILSVITKIVTNIDDTTEINLVYANETEDDILLKSEIDAIAAKYPNFSVFYTLTHPPQNWNGGIGYISTEMLQSNLPPPDSANRVFVCGPPEFKRSVLDKTHELGWEKGSMRSSNDSQVFCF